MKSNIGPITSFITASIHVMRSPTINSCLEHNAFAIIANWRNNKEMGVQLKNCQIELHEFITGYVFTNYDCEPTMPWYNIANQKYSETCL